MRFLKNKIALSAQLKAVPEAPKSIKIEVKQESSPTPPKRKTKEPSTRGRKKATPASKEEVKSTKTVVKNYGKAIASFAISPVAVPYLTPYILEEQVNLAEFVEYVGKAKENIEGIDTLRGLLLVKDNDDNKTASFKRVFRALAEIFVKYFSVNWIYSGRMLNKKVHLTFRFKMLRRIQSPELFTYLK